MIPVLAGLALIPTCGVLDRWIGRGSDQRVLPVVVGGFTLGFLGGLMGMSFIAAALFSLAFFVWRTPGWGLLGGSINPETYKEIFGTFLRHLFAMIYLLPAYFASVSMLNVAAFMVIFAVIATFLGIWNVNGLHNSTVEKVRGMVLGGSLFFGFVLYG